jgi:DNA-binding transcriptional regulator YiaG
MTTRAMIGLTVSKGFNVWISHLSMLSVGFRHSEPLETNRRSLVAPGGRALKLLQWQVAKQLEVNVASIVDWENNLSKPKVSHMPAIIRFLGYNPLPPSKCWADRLVQARTSMGLTQKGAAGRIGVDQCTLARWKRGEREPTGTFAARASCFLVAAETKSAPAAALTA